MRRVLLGNLEKMEPAITLIQINPREYNLGGGNGYSVPLGGVEGLKEILL